MISVVVPVYNVDRFLDSCLQGIENQTYTEYEVIIVDDGSTDRSFQICKDYCLKHKNWKVIHQKNAGLSAARNTGVKYAVGKYITFVDSDDILNKDLLNHLYRGIVETGAQISTCDYITVDENCYIDSREIVYNKPEIITGREAAKKLYTSEQGDSNKVHVMTWGKLFLKQIFDNIEFPAGRIHEDQATTYRALYPVDKVAVLNEKLYCYRVRKDSIMHQKFSIKRYADILAVNEAAQYFLDFHDEEMYDLVQRKKEQILASYALQAKKAGCYQYVNKDYKLSFCKIWRIMKKSYDEDGFEYVMYQYYPKLIRLRSGIRKICKTI